MKLLLKSSQLLALIFMKSVIGLCNVGQHVNKTGYLIIPFKPGESLYSPFCMVDPIISISNVEMVTSGLAIILRRLYNPVGDESKEISFLDKLAKKRMLRLKRDHLFVSLELLRGCHDEMKIIPLHGKRGWQFDRKPDEMQLFRLPNSNDEFIKWCIEYRELM